MTGLGLIWYRSGMERTQPQDLTSDELLARVLHLQKRIEGLEAREQSQRLEQQSQLIERQAMRMAELAKENQQLRQKLGQHPTQRLDEAYSLRAEEQRREAASQGGLPSKKKK